ncbi:MAG TPA: hypothetical protein VMX13_14055 [Sedimentisphaerales bacterium]|nr:hypothetical protein [Sedimentisphaerales bacterium]
MTLKDFKLITCLCLLVLSVSFVRTPTTLAVTPADADEWDSARPIEITIDSPATNTYLPINDTQSLHAYVRDCDEYRVDEQWYTYWDEVRSGNTSTDYHIWWEATEGTWNDMYGVYATYKAPEYESGSSIRTVTITAHANDIDRGDETPTDAGYEEDDETDSITLKIWQIDVTGQISGTTSSNYDGFAMPTAYGGTDLGWVEHGNPTGATGYFGNIQLKGSKSSSLNITTGFSWYNYVKGIVRHKTTTSEPSWVTPYDFNEPDYILDFGPAGPNPCVDKDMRHPDGGTDVSEIFALDAPGWDTGTDNDKDIPPLTYYDFCADYKAWVVYSGVPVSNECLWGVGFELDEVSGEWSDVFHALDTE